MKYVVTIPAINYLFLVGDLPGESSPPLHGQEGWTVQEGGSVEVAANFGEWPDGADAPRTTVCQSLGDPGHYQVFNHPDDVPPGQYRATGLSWGGAYPRKDWDRFVRESLPALLNFYAIPDTDPPGADELAMHYIREARRPWPGS